MEETVLSEPQQKHVPASVETVEAYKPINRRDTKWIEYENDLNSWGAEYQETVCLIRFCNTSED